MQFVWALVRCSSVNSDIVMNQRDKQYKMMKKHYEKMCMTPLGFVFEGNILQQASVLDDMTVTSVGQQVHDIDAEDQGWNTEWEW